MQSPFDSPIFTLCRAKIPEIVVHGATVIRHASGAITGSESSQMVMRDLLKPWQFMACDIDGIDAVKERFWAMGLSSHSGEPLHMQALKDLSEAAGAEESDLLCPRGYPFDWEVTARLRVTGQGPSRLNHPCAGKHLTMIAACRQNDYPISSYWDSSHPLQKRVFNLLGRGAGEPISWVIDNCGLQTAALSSHGILSLWHRLAIAEDEAAVRTKDLWIRNPRLVGGSRRLDSDIVELTEGKVLAKEGGSGLFVMQGLPDGSADGGVASCLINLASGYHKEHLALALWATLSRQESLPASFEMVAAYLRDRLSALIPSQYELVIPKS